MRSLQVHQLGEDDRIYVESLEDTGRNILMLCKGSCQSTILPGEDNDMYSFWGSEGRIWPGRIPRRWDVGQIVFGLETGVTTEGSCSFFLCYNPANSITRNTQLLYRLLWSY